MKKKLTEEEKDAVKKDIKKLYKISEKLRVIALKNDNYIDPYHDLIAVILNLEILVD